jgi:hypothetical protein
MSRRSAGPDVLAPALDDEQGSGVAPSSRLLRATKEQYAGLPTHYLFGAIPIGNSG